VVDDKQAAVAAALTSTDQPLTDPFDVPLDPQNPAASAATIAGIEAARVKGFSTLSPFEKWALLESNAAFDQMQADKLAKTEGPTVAAGTDTDASGGADAAALEKQRKKSLSARFKRLFVGGKAADGDKENIPAPTAYPPAVTSTKKTHHRHHRRFFFTCYYRYCRYRCYCPCQEEAADRADHPHALFVCCCHC
jgi:hypothetical protein